MSAFETSLAKLTTRAEGMGITPQSLVLLSKYAMEIVEATSLKGSEQKEMVIRLVKKIVEDSPLEEAEKKLCADLIEKGTISQMIDLVVDATKGRLKINQEEIIERGATCCSLLFQYWKTKKNKKAPTETNIALVQV